MSDNVPTRACAGCAECCTGQLRFKDVDMNGNEIIANSEMGCIKYSNGCTIYKDRPKTCRNFYCAWILDEGLPEWLKPNDCGFIIHRERRNDDHCLVITQNKSGPDINESALIWALWWCLTQHEYQVEITSRKYGNLKYR